MYSKQILEEFIYELNKIFPFKCSPPFLLRSPTVVGFSFDNSLPARVINLYWKRIGDQDANRIICVLADSENKSEGVFFTDTYIYVNTVVNSIKTFKINYADIENIKVNNLYSTDYAVCIQSKSDNHTLSTSFWNIKSIHAFLQFASEKNDFLSMHNKSILNIHLLSDDLKSMLSVREIINNKVQNQKQANNTSQKNVSYSKAYTSSHSQNQTSNKVLNNKFLYNRDKTFEVAVLSTMSSGKSTFINALIGKDLLPSKNQACTARTTAVLDNDEAQSVTGHVLFGDGTYQEVSDCTADQISDILENQKEKIADIVIECSIPEIRNIGRSLMIVDTPGANNVLDDTHGNTTRDYLQHLTSGLILYVLNATQIGTYDDTELLKTLKRAVEKNPNLSVYFILNKADSIDTKKEPLDNIVELCNTYLNKQGFKNAQIYPVSAKAALIFRKALSGQTLSESEEIDFYMLFSKFKTTDFSLPRFYSRPEVCVVAEEEYLKRDILAAVENTGLPLIERAIEAKLIEQTIIKAPEIANPYNVSSNKENRTENAPPKPTYDAFQKTIADLTRILSGVANSKK